MIRGFPRHKRDDDFRENDGDDAIASTAANEEEQWLRRGEMDFEDEVLPLQNLAYRRRGLWNFLRGPEPPRIQVIRPFFSSLQKTPIRVLDARGFNKTVLLATLLGLWFLIFASFLTTQLPIRDGNGDYVLNLDCVDTLWRRKNECGINGIDCRPFKNQSFAFRCPANCASVQLLNPYAIGRFEVNYRPLVIGAEAYRADSFVCGSAIHAGVISDRKGGCGRVTLLGGHEEFASTKHHGIQSIAYDSYFPKSFSVAFDHSFRCSSDPRSVLLPVSLFFTFALAIFFTSPMIFFPIFTLIFAHVSFVSDPPTASYRNISVLPDHISMFAKRLLPVIFIAIFIYRTIVKDTISKLNAQFEKALFWLGGLWIGALSNYSFDWIPISRLTAHDLEQQPGAKLALGIIILLLLAVIISQAYHFWQEGRLPNYLRLYGLFIFGILLCLMIPGVNLRLHHYILALLLLPGTSLQTRPSLLYQGILLGLFVNGIARWDFDSVLQTSDALRNDAKLNSAIPQILKPAINASAEGLVAVFAYGTPPGGVDGISILVNDVERARFFYTDEVEDAVPSFGWSRPVSMELNEYFRFAYVKSGQTLDYSKPGILFRNGTWTSDSN